MGAFMGLIGFVIVIIALIHSGKNGKRIKQQMKSNDPYEKAAGLAVAKFIFGCGLLAVSIMVILWIWPLILVVGFLWLIGICFPPIPEKDKRP